MIVMFCVSISRLLKIMEMVREIDVVFCDMMDRLVLVLLFNKFELFVCFFVF